ncbi:cell division protein SepF [Bacillota bacterium]
MGDGFFSKLKVLIGIEEIEEDEDEEASKNTMERQSVDLRSPYSPPRNEIKDREKKESADARVVHMAGRATGPNQFKMIVIEPQGFDECPRLVDSLKAKKPVIINLEKIETDTARKIFDFLSGGTYALNGNVQKVANNIFLFAPENVDVTAYMDQQSPGGTTTINNPWR